MIKLLLPCYILSPLLSFHKDCVKTTWHVSKLIMLTVNTARPISLWPVFVYLAVRPLWRNQKCGYYLQYMLRGQSSWCLTHHEITSKERNLFWTGFFSFLSCFFLTFFPWNDTKREKGTSLTSWPAYVAHLPLVSQVFTLGQRDGVGWELGVVSNRLVSAPSGCISLHFCFHAADSQHEHLGHAISPDPLYL